MLRAVSHARRYHRQLKRERELRPVVAVNLANRDRKRMCQFPEKVEAGVVILSCGERTHPGAAVQRGVLKDFLFRELDDRDVDLDGVARVLLSKSFISCGRRRGVLITTGTPTSRNNR